MFTGKGSEAPEAVALAIAPACLTPSLPISDVFSIVSLAILVWVLAVSVAVLLLSIAISALSAAIFLALEAALISANNSKIVIMPS